MLKRILLVAVMIAVALPAIAAKGDKKQLAGTVNINTATVQELSMLPGVGKSKAEAIVAYRQTSPFKSPSEITKVKGIGQKMFERIQQNVTIDGPTTAKLVKVQQQASPAPAQVPADQAKRTGL